MPDYLTMELGELIGLLRKGRVAAETVEETACHEAHFLARNRRADGTVELRSEFQSEPLFSVRGALTDSLLKFVQAGPRHMVLTLLLALPEGARQALRVTYQASTPRTPGPDIRLIRASSSPVPPRGKMVEFLFIEDADEFRYVFELAEEVEVLGFQEVVDDRPVFPSIPPVTQMAAFLRAMIHQRRTTLARLEDLARWAEGPATPRAVELLRELYPPLHEFVTPTVSKLQRLLKMEGRDVRSGALAALCLFLDLETGGLTCQKICRRAERGEDPPLSEMAAFAVTRLFCIELSAVDWDATFPEALHEEYRLAFGRPPFPGLIRALRESERSRTHLDILAELARESKSRRVADFVSRARLEVPGGFLLVNDEQRSLRDLLAEAGRPVHSHVLAALCLFVDVEVGLLTAEMLPQVTEGGPGYDTSFYALVAVAGAFDLQLRGLALQPVPEDGGRAFLRNLCEVTRGRLIGQFLKPGEPGRWMETLGTTEEVDRALDAGMQFTGQVLARFSVIDQLNEEELDLFLQAGQPLLACFTADSDRATLWRKLDASRGAATRAVPGRPGRHTCLHSYTVFSFSRQVLGRLAPCDRASVLGRRNFLTADRDTRGNLHFRFLEEVRSVEDLMPAGERGLVWTRREVRFPALEAIPECLDELGQTTLLGCKALVEEVRSLDLLYGALRELLTVPPRHVLLRSSPELLRRLERSLLTQAMQVTLSGLMEAGTRDGLRDRLLQDDRLEFLVFAPVAESEHPEVVDYLAMELLFWMCRSQDIQLERQLKQYSRSFDRAVRNRLIGMLDSQDGELRVLGARLLATADQMSDRNDRLVGEYELTRLREDEDPRVARAAFLSWAHLALAEVVPLPRVVERVGGTETLSGNGASQVASDEGFATRRRELAAVLTRAFELPQQYIPQVANMLLEIGPVSVYTL